VANATAIAQAQNDLFVGLFLEFIISLKATWTLSEVFVDAAANHEHRLVRDRNTFPFRLGDSVRARRRAAHLPLIEIDISLLYGKFFATS
jgi:exoribonuclease R